MDSVYLAVAWFLTGVGGALVCAAWYWLPRQRREREHADQLARELAAERGAVSMMSTQYYGASERLAVAMEDIRAADRRAEEAEARYRNAQQKVDQLVERVLMLRREGFVTPPKAPPDGDAMVMPLGVGAALNAMDPVLRPEAEAWVRQVRRQNPPLAWDAVERRLRGQHDIAVVTEE